MNKKIKKFYIVEWKSEDFCYKLQKYVHYNSNNNIPSILLTKRS